MHVAELSDKKDKGVTDSSGGNADFFRDQRNGNTISTTGPDVSDPTSDFWRTHERPDPFDPNDPELENAPLKPGVKEPDYTQYVVPVDDANGGKDKQGVTNSGGGNADFFRDQRKGENHKDTSDKTLTYKKHDDKLQIEKESEQTLETADEVRMKLNEISQSDYGYDFFKKAGKFLFGEVTNGFTDFLGSDFDIDLGKYTDYYGRPLYLEIGYKIKDKDRVFIGNQNSFVEREVFIYDKNDKEIYHDVYYTSHISD